MDHGVGRQEPRAGKTGEVFGPEFGQDTGVNGGAVEEKLEKLQGGDNQGRRMAPQTVWAFVGQGSEGTGFSVQAV